MKKNAFLLMLIIGIVACSADEYDNNLPVHSVELNEDSSNPTKDWDKTRYNNSQNNQEGDD